MLFDFLRFDVHFHVARIHLIVLVDSFLMFGLITHSFGAVRCLVVWPGPISCLGHAVSFSSINDVTIFNRSCRIHVSFEIQYFVVFLLLFFPRDYLL